MIKSYLSGVKIDSPSPVCHSLSPTYLAKVFELISHHEASGFCTSPLSAKDDAGSDVKIGLKDETYSSAMQELLFPIQLHLHRPIS